MWSFIVETVFVLCEVCCQRKQTGAGHRNKNGKNPTKIPLDTCSFMWAPSVIMDGGAIGCTGMEIKWWKANQLHQFCSLSHSLPRAGALKCPTQLFCMTKKKKKKGKALAFAYTRASHLLIPNVGMEGSCNGDPPKHLQGGFFCVDILCGEEKKGKKKSRCADSLMKDWWGDSVWTDKAPVCCRPLSLMSQAPEGTLGQLWVKAYSNKSLQRH